MGTIQSKTSSPEVPKRNILDLQIRWLYFLGLWTDDSTSDLELYLKYFNPLGARLLYKFGFLHKAFVYFQKWLYVFMTTIASLQSFFLFPVGVFYFWDDKNARIENVVTTAESILHLTGLITVYLWMEKLKNVVNNLEEISNEGNFDSEEQRKLFYDAQKFWERVAKYLYRLIIVCVVIPMAPVSFFHLRPNRLYLISEWYPYDSKSSPAYELTLFVRTVQMIFIPLCNCSAGATIVCILMYIKVHCSILNNKLVNIREMSVRKVNDRTLLPYDTLHFTRSSLLAGVPQAHNRSARETLVDVSPTGNVTSKDRPEDRALRHTIAGSGHVSIEPNRSKNRTLLNTQDALDVFLDEIETVESTIPDQHSYLIDLTLQTPSVEEEHKTKSNDNKNDEMETSFNEKDLTEEVIQTEMNIQLKRCIRLHQKLLEINRSFAEFTNMFLSVISLLNLLAFGGMLLLYLTADETGLKVALHLGSFSSIVLLFFLVNFTINLITDECTAVIESLYDCNWLDASPNFKRCMLIMMTRANQPVQYKPTGFDPLSLKLFVEITGRAYEMLNTMKKLIK